MLSLSVLAINTANAAVPAKKTTSKIKMVSSEKAIANLQSVIDRVKSKSHVPVLFPGKIPQPSSNQTYYASSSVSPDGGHYFISVDQTSSCNGAKYCNVGSVVGDLGKHPDLSKTAKLTKEVKLQGANKGYFTPAHAGADFWPSMMEWNMKDSLYSLSWKMNQKNEKEIMTELANSAIQKGIR